MVCLGNDELEGLRGINHERNCRLPDRLTYHFVNSLANSALELKKVASEVQHIDSGEVRNVGVDLGYIADEQSAQRLDWNVTYTCRR